jgi:hypothetical protein
MEPIGRPSYVVSPPAVIPIDIGRQLFVDDFLIEKTSLKRSFHAAEPYPGNPVFEGFPYSDGIWYDLHDQLFKMWYMGDSLQREYATSLYTRYATSKDGIHWERPSLDFIPGTNIVFKVPEGDQVLRCENYQQAGRRIADAMAACAQQWRAENGAKSGGAENGLNVIPIVR